MIYSCSNSGGCVAAFEDNSKCGFPGRQASPQRLLGLCEGFPTLGWGRGVAFGGDLRTQPALRRGWGPRRTSVFPPMVSCNRPLSLTHHPLTKYLLRPWGELRQSKESSHSHLVGKVDLMNNPQINMYLKITASALRSVTSRMDSMTVL
jgi:hypothetical protein